LRALVEGLQEVMRTQHKRKPLSVEGHAETGWVLLDFGDVIVHLFSPDKRAYYNLEGLWRDGKTIVRIQ
jgi:ribosome-associated protein